ncbi:uncharacterized protein LOC123316786 [Coccinella septempunctata]|uniref:uncharacterized protein LOC123316786 n=1 Tax=Coccinella septempunctata TaxID=41139 RepID=UPI001D06837C|nr:uncharacterized protein LOC123316786 [Coccinella septempunctata]
MSSLTDNDAELLQSWLDDMTKQLQQYKEPILEEEVVKVLKIACDTFKQDVHVFVTSIEVLEEYIRRKDKTYDEILILATSIFISSKYTGEQIDLKAKYIVKFLQRITNVQYNFKEVVAAEIEILRTLDGSLPMSTIVDDINTIIELHVRETRLKANVRPLCLEIVQLMYLCRKTWFAELKSIYSQNEESFLVLKFLMGCRLYLPVVILITCLHLTNYKYILDIGSIISDMTCLTKIHSDHLRVCAGIIINLIQNNNSN